ncbi:MAG: hypothetical protein ACI9OD_003831 [Limisphaerales bacterium]|jgi:hypothetical protein
MSPNDVLNLIRIALCAAVALFVGYCVAVGNYTVLFAIWAIGMVVAVVVTEGFSALIAFGLLCPFVLPVPFIRGFPILASVIGLCVVKFALRRAMIHDVNTKVNHAMSWGMGIFFGWVIIRYGIDPVFPNVRGIGQHITGFRAYMTYGICFGLLLFMGVFFTSRHDLKRLLWWMGMISLWLTFLLVPLVITKSGQAAELLTRYGMFVTTFDNGMLRFVVLPLYGTVILMIAMLPNLIPMRFNLRVVAIGVALVAIIFGGSRSSLLAVLIIVFSIAIVRWRPIYVSGLIAGMIALLALFHLIGENMPVREVGLLRVLSLTSKRVANRTDAAYNVNWRLKRWKRAMEDVNRRPLIGRGYGGLANAWVFQTRADYEAASIDIDVAAGSIHNGYLAGARALGVPIVVFFTLLYLSQMYVNYRAAKTLRETDPFFADFHCFIYAALGGQVVMTFFGNDLNDPWLWFLMGLGPMCLRMRKRELAEELEAVSPPSEMEPEAASVAVARSPLAAVPKPAI